MKLLLLSDIHGNSSAFRAILNHATQYPDIGACVILGDLIDYGMHSNEVLRMARALPYPILCNIHGNHENAILNADYSCFSSERGQDSARYTRSILNEESWDYLRHEMTADGKKVFVYNEKKCLAVHGSLEDVYWKSIRPEAELMEYSDYDYVFSGHSHLPHLIEKFYPGQETDNTGEITRRCGKKKVIFINPGSVGQPRNQNPMAQFVLLDPETEQVSFEKVPYDIESEQASYHGQVDDFYCERLTWGI